MIYYSEATQRAMTDNALWKLYQPVKHRYRYKEFKEILEYHPINSEEEIAGKITSQQILASMLARNLKRLSIENETLRLAIRELNAKEVHQDRKNIREI